MGTTEAAAAAGEGADGLRASLLPPPPEAPPDLTRATARYKRHAWLAVLGLLSFVGLYVSLTAWFCWTSLYLLFDLARGGQNGFLEALGGALSGLMGAFLLSALFFIKTGGKTGDLEVTAREEPRLFAFLNALADRAGAQRPHRVFLSMRVNAAVFYDLSLINLLFPSKKNLEIGLGLVNTLNLSEMTAVLAHEYGHFAQRSMAVGRWVYMAQQVAGQIVVSRSWLDRALGALSSVDIRVAWIGWLMRIVVWSIRSLLDTAFGLVILAQRALGREMEFQADLVSVSLAGSDALVHALYRLGAADGAWSNALGVAASEAGRGHAVPDLFAMQTRVIERMAGILSEPAHGASPTLPAQGRAEHRVFQQELAEPPRMWSTHPGNRDREDNAKRVYVSAEIDSRSAFCLFNDAEVLRRGATARFLSERSEKQLEPISLAASLSAVDKRFDRPHLAQRYRGVYLARSIVLYEKSPKQLYVEPTKVAALRETLSQLYPEQLASDVRDLRLRLEERAHLEALRDGLLDAPGGVIRHRGQVIQRRALVSVLAQVAGETETVRGRVEAHDRLCRASHLSAAREVGRGWHDYLVGLIHLHHYAAHAEANLEDARGHLANVFAIVTADGRITSAERMRLLVAAGEVHDALSEIFKQAMLVELPEVAIKRLIDMLALPPDDKPPTHWADVLPQNYSLPPPSAQNLPDFLRVLDSWVNGALFAIGLLERVSLELLVDAEAQVSDAYLNQNELGPAPEPPVVPARYPTMARGQERDRQKRLGFWDRFQTADGFFPSLLRFVVAGAILAGVLGFGGAIARPTLTVFNGLGVPVFVEIQGQSSFVEPQGHAALSLKPQKGTLLSARSSAGKQIESRRVTVEGSLHYVYDVAGAAPLVEWTAVYGDAREVPARELGALDWFATSAEVLFEEPPRSLHSSSGGTKVVLSGPPTQQPSRILSHAKNAHEREQMIAAHVLWDLPSAPDLSSWLDVAGQTPRALELVERRLEHYPDDVGVLRLQQDLSSGPARAALCVRAQERATASPDNPSYRYLALRCANDDSSRRGFLEEYRRNPQDSYFAYAAGLELWRQADYAAARQAYWVAARAPILKPDAHVSLARMLRLTSMGDDDQLKALATDSPPLRLLLALDSGDGVEGAERAFSLLRKGRLDEAVAVAKSTPETYAIVLRLAGASDGASRALIDGALALTDEPRQEVWSSIALAEREGRPHELLDAAARRFDSNADRVLPFAKARATAKSDAADAALLELEPMSQLQACVMALVRSAESAPAACRNLVNTAMFAPERPYFR